MFVRARITKSCGWDDCKFIKNSIKLHRVELRSSQDTCAVAAVRLLLPTLDMQDVGLTWSIKCGSVAHMISYTQSKSPVCNLPRLGNFKCF